MINLSKKLLPALLILGLHQTIYATPNSDLSTKNSWLDQALKLQREIDLNVPFNRATFLATHNSYNSQAYQIPVLRYMDPNQKLSIYDQLKAGVRSIEFDAHWTFDNYFSKDILLCHANENHLSCSVFDRKFNEGLQELRKWLIENPDEVVMLYIERHLDGHEPRLAASLELILGEFLFKPESVRAKDEAATSCVSLPASLSKADILKAGKQLFIVSTGCDGTNPNYKERNKFTQVWNNFVFSGIDGAPGKRYGFVEGMPKDFDGPPNCGKTGDYALDPSHSSMWRVYEDRTIYGNLPVPQKKIDEYTMLELVECGINWQALDMLKVGDDRLFAAVWSWAAGYPKQDNGECAVYKTDSGFVNADCKSPITAFACKNENTDEIVAMPATGMFRDGKSMCSSKGNEWHFIVPVNGAQLTQLQDSAQEQSLHEVWLNYRTNKDGKWIANG